MSLIYAGEDPCVHFTGPNTWVNQEPASFSIDYGETYIITGMCVPYSTSLPYYTRWAVGNDPSVNPCANDGNRYLYGSTDVKAFGESQYLHVCSCSNINAAYPDNYRTQTASIILNNDPTDQVTDFCGAYPGNTYCGQWLVSDISFQTAATCPDCVNGGYCPAGGGNCACPNGWAGADCSSPVCQNGCNNGGSCVNPNQCSCTSDWTDPTCSTPVCPAGCNNVGSCAQPGICSCPPTWTDNSCTTPVCPGDCQNGGTCTSPNTCQCTSDWTGSNCQTPVCQCQHGVCTSPGNCDCTGTGFQDPVCATPVCSQACNNGGSCTSPETCTCTADWTGPTCTTPVCDNPACTPDQTCIGPDTCKNNVYTCTPPCSNNGQCTSSQTCDCSGTGYEGATCANPVCTNACQNGGTCSAPGTCTCTSSWSGPTCSTPVCAQQCKNGGRCTGPNTCDCTSTGYSGNDCSTPVCGQPCLNGGSCTSPNTCTCATGYTGFNCSTPVCSSGCPTGSHCLSPNKCSPVPSVKSVTTCSTSGGNITISGVDFSTNSASIKVVIGGTKMCNVSFSNETMIICKMEAGTGKNYLVNVTVDGVSNSHDYNNTFSYAAPIITSTTAAPNKGGSVTIYGANFGTNASQIIVSINNSTTCYNVTVISQTSIRCNVAAGKGANVSVTVTVNGVTTVANHSYSYQGVCGDSLCYGQEDCMTCAIDCPSPCGKCGDSVCSGNETCSTCYEDCGACNSTSTCGDPMCNNQGSCVEGVCQCYGSWAGPYCDQTTTPFQVTITNGTQEITFRNLTFNIAIVAINEIDQYGNLVRSLPTTGPIPGPTSSPTARPTQPTPKPTPKPTSKPSNSTNSTTPTPPPSNSTNTTSPTPTPTPHPSNSTTPAPTPVPHAKREERGEREKRAGNSTLPPTPTPSRNSTNSTTSTSSTTSTTSTTSTNSTNSTSANSTSSHSLTSSTTGPRNSSSTTFFPSSSTTGQGHPGSNFGPETFSLFYNTPYSTINVTYTLYQNNATLLFANQTLSFAPDTLKVTINISKWAFTNAQNRLQIVMNGGLPGTPDPCLFTQQNDTNGNLQWYSLDNGDDSQLYARVFPLGVVDARPKRLTTYLSNSSLITEVPFFWTSAIIDPDYSILLKTADNPISPDKQDLCAPAEKSHGFNKKLFLKVALPVFLVVVGAFGGLFAYHTLSSKYGKRGIYQLTKSFSKTKNVNSDANLEEQN